MFILRYGSQGPRVEQLQLALSRTHTYQGNIDGIFGWRTRDAVFHFQRMHGLLPDGVVGEQTWAAILPYLRGYQLHTIRPGDTVSRIAGEYDTIAQSILQANPGLDVYNLTIGEMLAVPLHFPIVPTNIAFTSDVLDMVIDGLLVRYPFLQDEIIGQSVLGTDIYAISIGDGETEVFYNASHHANEWITTPVLMQFLEEYAQAVQEKGRIRGYAAEELFHATTLYVVPMVNPDGVDLVTGVWGEDEKPYRRAAAIAAHYPQIPFPRGWKANLAGVDLNLNYPAEWEQAREIKFALGYTTPAPMYYVGAAPLSQPETRALNAFTLRHDFALTISYHTQGEVIYWKFLDYNPVGSYEIAQQFAAVSGYAAEQTPYASGFAGYKDWFIQTYNRPGYTIEAGYGVSPLPLRQFPTIYRDNIGILVLGIALAAKR